MTDEQIKFIEELKKQIKDLQGWIDIPCLVDTPYIVTVGDIPLTFTITDKREVTEPKTTTALKAMGFTKKSAEMVAKTVKNGRDDTGVAVGRYQAVLASIKNLQHIVDSYEDMVNMTGEYSMK